MSGFTELNPETHDLDLLFLGTCLPDYFLGYEGHVFAVPLSARPRNGEVLRGLQTEISNDDAIAEDAAVILIGKSEQMFARIDLRQSWSRIADDLSESYAYFGVVATPVSRGLEDDAKRQMARQLDMELGGV